MPRYMAQLPLLVLGMGGLGDGIYQRPLVRAQAQQRPVFLTTPWPELYADLPGVHPVRPWSMKLRTQEKHLARVPDSTWHAVPNPHERRALTYSLRQPGVSILAELEARMRGRPNNPWPCKLPDMDLPDLGPCPVQVPAGRRLAVVRPSTIRAEWPNRARAPRPEYLYEAAAILRASGYYVVTVADVAPPQEWLEGKAPPADLELLQGELTPPQVLALVRHADVAVGGVGWLVPAALAAKTRLVVVAGGQGGHNAPELVVDRRVDARRTRWVMPDRYCRCTQKDHPCNKAIPDFGARFARALEEVAAA